MLKLVLVSSLLLLLLEIARCTIPVYLGAQVASIPLSAEPPASQQFIGSDGQTRCKWCELDCQASPILTCKYRYLRYGCHIDAYCLAIDATEDMEYHAAFGLCMMYNQCTLQTQKGLTDEEYYYNNRPSAPYELRIADLTRTQVTKCTNSATSTACKSAKTALSNFQKTVAEQEEKYLKGLDGKPVTSYAHLLKRSILYKDLKAKPSLYLYFKVIQDLKEMIIGKQNPDYDAAAAYANALLNKVPEWWRIKYGIARISTGNVKGIMNQYLLFGTTKMDQILDSIKAALAVTSNKVGTEVEKMREEWIRDIMDPTLSLGNLLFASQTKTLCKQQFFANATEQYVSLYVGNSDFFLRHWCDYAHASANDWFYVTLADGTFKKVPGLYKCEGFSLESVNFPGHYLAFLDSKLAIHKYDGTTEFEQVATFSQLPAPYPPGRYTDGISYYIRLYDSKYFIQQEGGMGSLGDAFIQSQTPTVFIEKGGLSLSQDTRCKDSHIISSNYYKSLIYPTKYWYANLGNTLELRDFAQAGALSYETSQIQQQMNTLSRFIIPSVKGIKGCQGTSFRIDGNHYIQRRWDNTIYIQQYKQGGSDQNYFEQQSTWKVVPGLYPVSGKVTASFESSEFPGLFITQHPDLRYNQNIQYYVFVAQEKNDADVDLKKRQTFIVETQDV